MNPTRFAVTHRATIMAIVILAVGMGAVAFTTMPRREDPEIVIRESPVITFWPGAPASRVEELVTDPLETAISGIAEVDEIRSDSTLGMSVIFVELRETIPEKEIDQLWDEVRNEVNRAAQHLPEGCGQPWVNTNFGDVASVCLALYQLPAADGELEPQHAYTWRELDIWSDLVESDLKTIPSVSKVSRLGLQDEVIEVEVDNADWSKIGVTSRELSHLLEGRNIVAPGGEIDTTVTRYPVRPTGDFTSVRQIGSVVVSDADDPLPATLAEMPVRVRRTHIDPPQKRVRFVGPEGKAPRSVLLQVEMKAGYNVVEMGNAVAERVRHLKAEILPADIAVTRMNDLPRQVDTLVAGFVENLLQAIAIVLAVAFLMMGWRPAIIMATAVPLSMISSLLVVRMFGVELEQFSIASMIIALGMIVDNAIVVSDNTVRLLDEGMDRREAAVHGASGLAIPILTSTLTTVAAFLPMLTITGSMGEYVRSLPIVVATTLLMSYVVAMLVTPIMCYWMLKSPVPGQPPAKSPMEWIGSKLRRKKDAAPSEAEEQKTSGYDRLMMWCLAHKAIPLGIALVMFIGVLQLLPIIGNQFFPQGERDQFFVEVWLPNGSSQQETERVVSRIEDLVLEGRHVDGPEGRVDRLANITSFVGTGGPRLFLTAAPEQDYAHYAYIVVNTTAPQHSAPWVEQLRAQTQRIPGARINVLRYLLGPPLTNPVEVRLIGPDDNVLRQAAEDIIQILRGHPGVLNPNSNWGNSSYELKVDIDAQAANLAGVTNDDVARTLNGLISGAPLTTYREGDHTVRVSLRLKGQQRASLGELSEFYVEGGRDKVPLGAVATIVPGWQPSQISRLDQERTVTVGAKLQPGFLATKVANDVEGEVADYVESLGAQYSYEWGGEPEKTAEATGKIGGAFSLSFVLILLVLISQYNSFLKPGVVLAAVPLSLIGALIGLFLTGWPLGFMPMLGLVSLAGVVINNAIILIDFIEQGVAEGKELRVAVAEAGRLRMKPIMLTTLTTVGGMLPLAFFGGPMWAGMAWATIFGLSLSTLLTLVVVPTLYTLFVEKFRMKVIQEG